MKKKVIRTKTVLGISSRIVQALDDDVALQELERRFGKDYILKNVFGEDKLSYQDLLEEYEKFIHGQESSLFAWMYMINDRFGVVLDAHIYIYHYHLDISNQIKQIFPWEYAESKKYMGDTWWFDDDEIIKDINELSILDFLEKYRGI